MSACIIPAGPDFQDPVAAPNYAPYIESATPDFGSVVSILTSFPFQVTVTDPNVEDNLYFQWVADYPGYTTNTRKLVTDQEVAHSVDGTPLHAIISVPVDCGDGLAATANAQHQLEVIVADRPFVAPTSTDMNLDVVMSPGLVVRANWTFQITCQSPPSP